MISLRNITQHHTLQNTAAHCIIGVHTMMSLGCTMISLRSTTHNDIIEVHTHTHIYTHLNGSLKITAFTLSWRYTRTHTHTNTCPHTNTRITVPKVHFWSY